VEIVSRLYTRYYKFCAGDLGERDVRDKNEFRNLHKISDHDIIARLGFSFGHPFVTQEVFLRKI